MKHLEGLAAFFGVPVGYFFREELAALVDAQLELATALRDVPVRHIALRAAGLSDEALSNIAQIIEHVRHIEGLDDTPHRQADPASRLHLNEVTPTRRRRPGEQPVEQ